MSSITTKQLRQETSAVLNEVERGQSFEVTRKGKVIGRIEPAGKSERVPWETIMGPVREAQKCCKSKTANVVMEERRRRRR